MSDELTVLRIRFGQLVRLVMWCHVPILGAAAQTTGTMAPLRVMLIGVLLALIHELMHYRYGVAPATRYVAAVLLVAQPALLLLLMQGHLWQMDMHMYFFAMIALNVGWFDRNALLVAATATALHHLVLLHFLPMAVFSVEGDLHRVMLHAVIVAFQTIVLVWVTNKITKTFRNMARLSDELRANGRALEERSREAEAASRSKGMFLANMSHEIRTPINAILGFCHLIQRGRLDARQRDQIGKINSAGVTLLRLVNDILDLSKSEAGHLVLEEAIFDLRAEMQRQIQILAEPLHKKHLRIRAQVESRIPTFLVGDVTRLNQVVTNLLSNAIKFTDKGMISIRLDLADMAGDVAAIRISVQDTGIGMTAEQLSRMFTPFAQADSSTTRRFGGTGLGLAICRQIVERMGGWIKAESVPGEGSLFTLLIRLRVAETQNLPETMPSNRIRRLNILFVEDNPIARRIVQELFQRWSMVVDMAETGQQALVMARRAARSGLPYDVVLLDWKMPAMDGLETLRALRAELDPAVMPLAMMMSAYDIEDLIHEARADGVSAFIGKPISAGALLDALNQLPLPSADDASQAGASQGPAVPAGLRGQRVLLVEDNEINREIAVEILSDAGLSVDCAADGAIACRMVDEAGGYAAVLMDIQMPVMDGIAATRQLRRTWPSDRLPIIAMTAHAFAEERQTCLDAGMDDHLTKPIDPVHLVATLGRWLRLCPPAAAPAGGTAELPATLPPFDIPAALARINGKQALLRRLILSFADNHAGFCDQMAALLRDGAIAEAHRLAHTLKGVASSLELARITDLAALIEQALAAAAPRDISDLLAALAPHLDHAVAAARQLQPQVPPVETRSPYPFRTAQPEPAALAAALAALRDLLRRHSLSARQGFQRLADLLELDDTARQGHPMHQALQSLDYATAMALLDRDFPEAGQERSA